MKKRIKITVEADYDATALTYNEVRETIRAHVERLRPALVPVYLAINANFTPLPRQPDARAPETRLRGVREAAGALSGRIAHTEAPPWHKPVEGDTSGFIGAAPCQPGENPFERDD